MNYIFIYKGKWAYSYNEHRFERDLGGKWNVANHWVAAPGVVT